MKNRVWNRKQSTVKWCFEDILLTVKKKRKKKRKKTFKNSFVVFSSFFFFFFDCFFKWVYGHLLVPPFFPSILFSSCCSSSALFCVGFIIRINVCNIIQSLDMLTLCHKIEKKKKSVPLNVFWYLRVKTKTLLASANGK